MSTNGKHTPRQRGLRITLVLVIAASLLVACGSDDGSAATGPDPCNPYGTQTTLKLNDRCVGDTADDFGDEFAGALRVLGYWVDDQSCPNGALVVAQPREILVTTTAPGQLGGAVAEVISRLESGGTPSDDFKTNLAQVIEVPDNVEVADVLKQLPALQGAGWSADLNYLEPLQPNNGFRPADDPHTPAGDIEVPDTVQVDEEASVLVLDSTEDTNLYDVDGNHLVDEDHGHGVFVQSIIQRRAPQAIVTLQGVTSTANRLPSGRWVPMMFSDIDIISAMESHFGTVVGEEYVINKSFDVVNLSLGGAGCTTSGFGYGVGERVALGRVMAAFSRFDSTMRFVAAAGNDHGLADHKEFWHYPAAWRDQAATDALATAVDQANRDPNAPAESAPAHTPEGNEVREIHVTLRDATIAVGASDSDAYTNCGDWINAKQPGTEIGTYPSATGGVAQWSGTSFATANESALVAAGEVPNDSLLCTAAP